MRASKCCGKLVPVKVCPNINSSGGSNAFGVVVLVMESFDGSMLLIFVPTEASAWIL
jgi:hypothetical protein